MAPRFSIYGEPEEDRFFSTDFSSGGSYADLLSSSVDDSEMRINGLTSDRNALLADRNEADDPEGWKTGGGIGSLLMGALGGYIGGSGSGLESLYATRGAEAAGKSYMNNLAEWEKTKKAEAQKDIDVLNTLIRDEVNNVQALTGDGLRTEASKEAQQRQFGHAASMAQRQGQFVGTPEYERREADEIAKIEASARARGEKIVDIDVANMALQAAGLPLLDPVKHSSGVSKEGLNAILRGQNNATSVGNLSMRGQEGLIRESSKLGGDKDFLPWIGTTSKENATASAKLNGGTDSAILSMKQLQEIYERNGGTPQTAEEAANISMLSARVFAGMRALSETGMTLNAGELPLIQSFIPDKPIYDQSFADTLKARLMQKNSRQFLDQAIKIIDRERVTKDLSYNFYHKGKKHIYDELYQTAPEVYAPYKAKFENSRTEWRETGAPMTMYGPAGGSGPKPRATLSPKVQAIVDAIRQQQNQGK